MLISIYIPFIFSPIFFFTVNSNIFLCLHSYGGIQFQVSQKTMHKYEQESRKLGKQSFLYAWVLDETGEERNRGITMDVGRSQFETNTKRVSV